MNRKQRLIMLGMVAVVTATTSLTVNAFSVQPVVTQSTLEVKPVVTQATLRVVPTNADENTFTEPMDTQAAMGYKTVQNTVNPQ